MDYRWCGGSSRERLGDDGLWSSPGRGGYIRCLWFQDWKAWLVDKNGGGYGVVFKRDIFVCGRVRGGTLF